MGEITKSQDLLLIEKCFKEIKMKERIPENLKIVERAIKRHFDITIHTSIINNTTNEFFGMTIYPNKSTIDAVVESILNPRSHTDQIIEIWKNNKEWYLEIDSILLYDANLNANPSELTAVLLHEIGHVINSATIPQRLSQLIKYEVMKLSYSIKKMLEAHRIRKLFDFVVIEGCSSKNFKFINTQKEIDADTFVVQSGYGTEMDNFINKLISFSGNKYVNRDDKEFDVDIKTLISWSIENASELEFRKTKLRTSLQSLYIRTPSIFVKELLDDVRNTFFGNDENTYKQALHEQYFIEGYNKALTESLLDIFDNIGKIKKIAQSDIDILSVEVDKIQNNDDRIYVLDLIYDKLDLVDLALDYIAKGKPEKVSQSKSALTSFKDQLEKLRLKVVNTQVKDKQYGVFVKYPKGYEG